MKIFQLLAFAITCQLLVADEPVTLKISSTSGGNGWQKLDFSKGAPNQVLTEADQSIKVVVKGSAGTLVYPFPEPRLLSKINFKGHSTGLINLNGRQQGADGSDDFVLRFGVIYESDKKLNKVQAAFAPDWIKSWLKVSPSEKMISKISLYNVASGAAPSWKMRSHPLSRGLIDEHIVSTLTQPGKIDFSTQLSSPHRALGLWLSCDGDDTQSNFEVVINQISVE